MLLYVFLELDDLLELDDFLELDDLEEEDEEDEEEPDEERLAAALTAFFALTLLRFFGLAFAFTLLRLGEAAALPLARCVRFHSEPTI